jgi:hypothetical protein
MLILRQVWWYTSVIPAMRKMEVGVFQSKANPVLKFENLSEKKLKQKGL